MALHPPMIACKESAVRLGQSAYVRQPTSSRRHSGMLPLGLETRERTRPGPRASRAAGPMRSEVCCKPRGASECVQCCSCYNVRTTKTRAHACTRAPHQNDPHLSDRQWCSLVRGGTAGSTMARPRRARLLIAGPDVCGPRPASHGASSATWRCAPPSCSSS